jgi:hypothetical protein
MKDYTYWKSKQPKDKCSHKDYLADKNLSEFPKKYLNPRPDAPTPSGGSDPKKHDPFIKFCNLQGGLKNLVSDEI